MIAPAARVLARCSALPEPCDTRAVPDLASLCKELETTWHREIPLAAAMGIGVADYDGRTLTVRAPLPPNRNVHGTAFAGSLFSACVLTGWGAVWLALRERGLTGGIVVADSTINYRKAIAGELVCRCTPDVDALRTGLDQLATAGRATFDLVCAIDQADKRAVTFTGRYVVHAQHS
jgi:thioesterase domain-containing protein